MNLNPRPCGAGRCSLHNFRVPRNQSSEMRRELLMALLATNQFIVEARHVRLLEDNDGDDQDGADAASSSHRDNNGDGHKSIFDNTAVVVIVAVVGVILAIAGAILVVVRRRRRRALDRNSSTSPLASGLSPAHPVGVAYAQH
ncbi:hypothetical protein V7S43_013802 [Phytophthora oleae]|uniref:Uncharacterized protein n=1 Tax=Phytophthora oleae TaxID=2107226 RepID=A0ABD3F6W0_9STRA